MTKIKSSNEEEHTMAKGSKMSEQIIGGLAVTQIRCTSEGDTDWVRTSPDTVLPSRVNARFDIAEPAVGIDMRIHIDASGRPAIRHLEIDCTPGVSVSISLMRRLPVETMMREALARSIVEQPDALAGEPRTYERFKPVAPDRIERVAEVYRLALAGGSSTPTKVVTATLGYSNATASRDIRLARKRGLIPPLVELRIGGSEAPRETRPRRDRGDCVVCGGAIPKTATAAAKTCSAECLHRGQGEWMARGRRRERMDCVVCGVKISDARRPNVKTCSDACRRTAHTTAWRRANAESP